MDFTTVLNKRRSIRSFTGEPISEDSMKKILHAANAAPVGLGKYDSVHLTVIQNPEILAEIDQNTAAAFKAEGRSFLYNAPQMILVSTASADNVGCSNAAIIAQNMALAATDEEVGACHIWSAPIALSANPQLVQKLEIPENFTPSCALIVGKTNEIYTEREISEDRIAIHYL